MTAKKKDIASLGEFGLIKHLTDKIAINHKTTLKGIGDDAAVLHTLNTEKLLPDSTGDTEIKK